MKDLYSRFKFIMIAKDRTLPDNKPLPAPLTTRINYVITILI